MRRRIPDNLLVAALLLLVLGLAAGTRLEETLVLNENTVEILEDATADEPAGAPNDAAETNSTQATITPNNVQNVPVPVGIAGQAVAMFVEVTASERTFIRDASPQTRLELNATAPENRTLFQTDVAAALAALKPRFTGGAQYFTGENFVMGSNMDLVDGVPFPAPPDSAIKEARFSNPAAMTSVTTKAHGLVTKQELLIADNHMVNLTGMLVPEKGRIRRVDTTSGETSTLTELDEQDAILNVAAHSVNISGVVSTVIYTIVDKEGFYWYNAESKNKSRLIVPGVNNEVKWGNSSSVSLYKESLGGLKEACFAADANHSVYLQYRGKIYDFQSHECGERQAKCEMRYLADYDKYVEGGSMRCAVHAEGANVTFFAAQGNSVNSIELGPAMLPQAGETTTVVLAEAGTKGATDGATPLLGSITGLSVYLPPWADADDVHVVLVAGGQLKVMSSKTGYSTTLAQVGKGLVAVAGGFAFSGMQMIWKSDLSYRIPCAQLNALLSKQLLEWKVPQDKPKALETIAMNLHDEGSARPWEFTAMKKTAVLNQGFMEKAMVCMHRWSDNVKVTKEKHIHCCITKFSKQHQGRLWKDQIIDTELY